MTHMTQQDEADQWWDRYRDLQGVFAEIAAGRQAVARRWRDMEPSEARERVWDEHEMWARKEDIAIARIHVAWARYIVAKHGLTEADVFDVE